MHHTPQTQQVTAYASREHEQSVAGAHSEPDAETGFDSELR